MAIAAPARTVVNGGGVIPTGAVRSWAERLEAGRIAWPAPGVARIENRITVRP
jgi:osmotically-inducible protein OsmY